MISSNQAIAKRLDCNHLTSNSRKPPNFRLFPFFIVLVVLFMMMAAILTMGFAACSSTDDDEEGEQPEKQKPEVPISDSD